MSDRAFSYGELQARIIDLLDGREEWVTVDWVTEQLGHRRPPVQATLNRCAGYGLLERRRNAVRRQSAYRWLTTSPTDREPG